MWYISTPPANIHWEKGKQLFQYLFGYENTDKIEYMGIPGVVDTFDKLVEKHDNYAIIIDNDTMYTLNWKEN